MQNRTSQVLLATGELCLKSELQEGMELLDEHSNPQVLKRLEVRNVPAFEVRPLKGEPFLMGFDQKILAQSLKANNYLLLGIADYVKQSPSFKSSFGLFHPVLQFPTQELPLDPYFLGLLLGDGCFRSNPPCLTTPDPEIVETIYTLAEEKKWPLRVVQTPANLSNAYYFKKNKTGSLKTHLMELGLWNLTSKTKFIPHDYLYGSRQDRLALLAGLLDTDGYLQARHYEIVSASFPMADDIAFLARSLGLAVIEKEKIYQGRSYARLFIHGDFSEVPIQVHHKKLSFFKRKRNVQKTAFTVHPAGVQDVFYLDIDSYLTGDLTIRKGDVL